MKKKKIPLHVAIIMDGNGRWAARRGLSRSEGHRRGMDVVRQTIKTAMAMGVQYLTLYAFSSENWRRPEREVQFLMKMCEAMINKELPFMIKNDIRLLHIGCRKELPDFLQQTIDRVESLTRNNRKLCVVLAFNYGARAEIVRAAARIAECVQRGEMKSADISEATLADNLYTRGVPDPDLLIRTSGEMRLSNFLLWQLCYAELHVTKTMWPDFRKKDFQRALRDYQERIRRFGGL